MKNYRVIIDVFDKEKLIDSFCFGLDSLYPVVFPDRLPYQGMTLYISGSVENGFSFSPDGYEMWIKFSKEHDGKCITYLVDRSYTFYFRVREDNTLHEMAMNNKMPGPTDRVDEFDRIKDFKKR